MEFFKARVNRKSVFSCSILLLGLLGSSVAGAVCPICTIAVGAGIGLTSWLGIDDVITGLWIGGLIVSMIMWTIRWLDQKNLYFKGRKILFTVLYYSSVIIPLHYQGYLGHMLNKLWGIDKLILGIVLGSITFFTFSLAYNFLKKHHGNKAYFPLQKVVMPIAPLVLLSIIFYYVTK